MTFSSSNLNPLIGSKVECDLESLLSGRYCQDIRELLLQRGVLVIRDVPMSADQQREIARSLGDLRLDTVKKEGDEGLLKVSFDSKVNPNRTHPLVWRHKSGRKSLVLSTPASHIVGMHPAASHDLLQRLMAHATQEKFSTGITH